jgi:hypothetical protein
MPSAARNLGRIVARTRSASIRIGCILAMAVALIGAGSGAAFSVPAHVGTPTIAPSQDPKPTTTIWGACPNNGREQAEHPLNQPLDTLPNFIGNAAMADTDALFEH